MTRTSALDIDLVVPGRVEVTTRAEDGDVLAVVGPNGAGKTSLVQALAGLVEASGHARLHGRDLLPLPCRDRDIGLVFQDQRLFPHLSALDNVAFGLRARGGRRRVAEAQARQWLERFDLGDLIHRRPRELSGGQAQRVAIARALATRPRLLLLDEPFAGLDVGIATMLRADLARRLREFDGVTLLVTHDPLEAQMLATRILVLDAGRVAQEGSPQDVAAQPRTEHVARLVGLNLVRDEDRLGAFRPRDVVVSRTRPDGSARHQWHGPVASIAPHGDAVRLLVRADVDLLADVTAAAIADLDIAPGSDVWLSAKETAMTWYADRRGQPLRSRT